MEQNKTKEGVQWFNKHPGLTVLGIIVAIILVAIIFSSGGSSSSSTPVVSPDTSTNTQPSVCSTDIATLKQAKTIDFKQLSKDPDSHKGTASKYTGQVVEIKESDGQGYMRLAVTKASYGWSMSDIIFVVYQGHTDAVQDDVVTVYGYLGGSYTYTSQANFQITIPSFVACEVDKGNPVPAKTSVAKPAVVAPAPSTPSPVSSNPQPQAPASSLPPTPPAPQATWHTINTFTGSTDTKTAPFALNGTQWRITYSCSSVNTAYDTSALFGSVTSTTGITGGHDSFADDAPCPANNSVSYAYAKTPGQYYLDMQPVNSTYTVTLEDYY